MKKINWIPASAGMTVWLVGMTMLFLGLWSMVLCPWSASAAEPAQVQLKLDDSFKKELQCGWKSEGKQKFWVGPIEDAREEKNVGTLVTKKEDVPVESDKPVAEVIQGALEQGLKDCGYKLVSNKEAADFRLTGRIDAFSGSSKKGFFKGEAEGRAELTLNLTRASNNEVYSVSIGVGETKKKGVSKKPKKYEEMLNRLLTRLTVDVLESRNIANWMKK
ncbi:MAG: YajG family lipoprotein [Deltaproteobacteria bacterium]|nr:YajG family lipoprotein [Deltaproteobacteria bacterium]